MNRIKLIYASAWAATASVVFVVLVTIYGEFAAPFKNWLAALSGHHWTTKSILSVLIYLLAAGIIYAVRKEVAPEEAKRSLGYLFWAVIAGALALLGFFTAHYAGIF